LVISKQITNFVAMDSYQVINGLANNKKLKGIAYKIAGRLGDDLWQTLFLILCDMPKFRIIELYKNKSIEYYCINILSNEFHNKKSLFSKETRHQMYDEDIEDYKLPSCDYEIERENIAKMERIDLQENPIYRFFAQRVTQDNFYKVELLRRWAEGESYRQISKRTNIPMRSIAHEIQKTINELKEQCLSI